ncbi:MAG: ATP-binding cassette domain-containing protein [Dehalococcoidales bacterium]|nr:ATP-binding cassette domain-containing protein [Dehalococcoidales bacterium]
MTSQNVKRAKAGDDFAIQTFNLTRKFNSLVAVDGIDLNIKRGELFALLGPNGAGKTTTINMLCCLLKPSGGTAQVLGYDILKQPFKIKETIGVSPQETVISEHLNPQENLVLIGKIHGIDTRELKSRSQELLETMGLEARAKDQVRKFSGGMKRRLNIMMALIHNPKVLFLDEPTLGLDPQARRAIWEYIIRLKKEKTILLTTHYMDEADFLADRIGIMDEGKIVALGTSRELKTGLLDILEKHTIVIHAQNFTQKVISEMRTRYAEVEVTEDTMVISDKQLGFQEIVDLLHISGVTVSSAYTKEPTLDDVFLNITGKELRE